MYDLQIEMSSFKFCHESNTLKITQTWKCIHDETESVTLKINTIVTRFKS